MEMVEVGGNKENLKEMALFELKEIIILLWKVFLKYESTAFVGEGNGVLCQFVIHRAS